MAKAIVTQALVNEAAEALMGEGTEPSILNVQARIGGGSYSTVKRYLDVWKARCAAALAEVKDIPPEVEARGKELTASLWTLASAQANRQAQAAREEAQAEVNALREELSEARNEIARLEGVETEQAGVIQACQARLREVELALTEAKTQASRVPELEKALSQSRTEADVAKEEARRLAVELGRLTGEAETLRVQVRELMAAIKPRQAPKRKPT